jgi:hypothetical protein
MPSLNPRPSGLSTRWDRWAEAAFPGVQAELNLPFSRSHTTFYESLNRFHNFATFRRNARQCSPKQAFSRHTQLHYNTVAGSRENAQKRRPILVRDKEKMAVFPARQDGGAEGVRTPDLLNAIQETGACLPSDNEMGNASAGNCHAGFGRAEPLIPSAPVSLASFLTVQSGRSPPTCLRLAAWRSRALDRHCRHAR